MTEEQQKQKSPQQKAQEEYRAGQRKEALGKTTTAIGKGVQVAGRGVQVAGRGITRAGGGMVSVGTELSSTGVGAVAGVPLMVGGAVTSAVGLGTTVAGTGVRTTGRGMISAGRTETARGRMQKRRVAMKAADSSNSPKISQATKYLMYGTSLFFDLLIALINLIPVVGQIIGFIISIPVYGFFFFWFMSRGVRMLTPKKLATMGLGFLFSWTPLPAITTSVFFTIYFEKKDGLLAVGKVAKVAKPV